MEGVRCFETLEYAHLMDPAVMYHFRSALIGALNGAVMAVEYVLEVRIDVRIEPGSIKALYTIDFEAISSVPASNVIFAVEASVDALPNLESMMKDVLDKSLSSLAKLPWLSETTAAAERDVAAADDAEDTDDVRSPSFLISAFAPTPGFRRLRQINSGAWQRFSPANHVKMHRQKRGGMCRLLKHPALSWSPCS